MSTSGEMTERSWRGWMSFIAEASDLLAGTLDPQRTLALIAQLFVPRLSTWCAVYNDEADPRPAYVWHTDEDESDLLRDRLITDGPPPQGPPISWHGEVACTIPLIARGRPIGAIALGRTDRFTPDLVELAEELGRRSRSRPLQRPALRRPDRHEQGPSAKSAPPNSPRSPASTSGSSTGPPTTPSTSAGTSTTCSPAHPGPTASHAGGSRSATSAAPVPKPRRVTGLARHALRILAGEGLP